MLSAQITILWSMQQDPEMDKVLPDRQKTASGTRRCTIILRGCPIQTTPRYALGPLLFFCDIYQQPTWCGPTPQCQTFLQTAFCTAELKTNMTRPYFNKTLTLSENGITCGKWNLTQANTMPSASCPTSKVPTASYFLHRKHWKQQVPASTWASPSTVICPCNC